MATSTEVLVQVRQNLNLTLSNDDLIRMIKATVDPATGFVRIAVTGQRSQAIANSDASTVIQVARTLTPSLRLALHPATS